ncbi:MAG: hypothetical protein MUQ32_17740, partial [Chloroflexi bacterium]|nr:hypothetical protein [Chloroflexota bacterium]
MADGRADGRGVGGGVTLGEGRALGPGEATPGVADGSPGFGGAVIPGVDPTGSAGDMLPGAVLPAETDGESPAPGATVGAAGMLVDGIWVGRTGSSPYRTTTGVASTVTRAVVTATSANESPSRSRRLM